MSQANEVMCSIQGGLGNQCFIYAAARSLADRVQSRLGLDVGCLTDDHIYRRPFELDAFAIRSDGYEKPKIRPVRLFRKARYRLLSQMAGRLGNWCCERYPFRYQRLPEAWSGVLRLDGYWQSEGYFLDNATRIAQDLILRNRLWLDADPVAQCIRQVENPVFLHIRSYKEIPGRSDGSSALPVAYYENALRELESRIGRSFSVFVFSDDLDWAKSRLRTSGRQAVAYVEPIKDAALKEELRDFSLMRLCKHGIVANSSFSWWAGWLGEQDRQRVSESPIRIRVNKRCMNDDYWPQRWIAIDEK